LDHTESAASVALRRRIKRLARTRLRPGFGTISPSATPPPPMPARRAEVIGIAASTGGPQAVEVVLAGLPADFPIPILIVQHMSEGFLDGLVRWLDQRVALPVRMAEQGAPLSRGAW